MNPFEMVVLIVAIVMIAGVLKNRRHNGPPSRHDARLAVPDSPETDRLRDEVRQLKERIQVLERITVEKENSLSRQIEELRDKP